MRAAVRCGKKIHVGRCKNFSERVQALEILRHTENVTVEHARELFPFRVFLRGTAEIQNRIRNAFVMKIVVIQNSALADGIAQMAVFAVLPLYRMRKGNALKGIVIFSVRIRERGERLISRLQKFDIGLAIDLAVIVKLRIIAALIFMSAIFRNVSGVCVGTGGVFFVSYMLSIIPDAAKYLPTKLLESGNILMGKGTPSDYKIAIAVAMVMAAGFVVSGIVIFNKKEI